MYAYCGNNPVMNVDPSGRMWSSIWSFVQNIAVGVGKAMSSLAPAYGGAGGVALLDGPLPFGDVVAAIGIAVLTVGAIGYGVYLATQEISKSKAEEKTKVVPLPPDNSTNVYYHVTTPENAAAIINTGVMTGSNWEGGYVYAWKTLPNQYAIENSGAHMGVIISFQTNAQFVMDMGITDPKVQKYGPVVSTAPGPILVWDVKIVR